MVQLSKNNLELVDKIYAHYEKGSADAPTRLTRLGASSIGDECSRSIWLSWRGASGKSNFRGRMLRLFETGHIQEDRILKDLANAGLEVWGFDPDGNQWTYTDGHGHFVAKLDGVVRGVPGAEKTPHTLEIKTANQKSFSETSAKGVKATKPYHYAQMQIGMHLAGLDRSLYVMLNKNDESFYIERVQLDPAYITALRAKMMSLVEINSPPPRISEGPDKYPCTFCDERPVCWGQVKPVLNCRTCAHATPVEDGAWSCEKHGTGLTPKEQLIGCDHWSSAL